jgi:hypothetical protein
MNTHIPKIINVTWATTDILDSQNPLILNGLRNLIDLNPGWKVVIHEDKDLDNYLRDHVSYNDYNMIRDIHIVEKSDIWRLLKLYNEGGCYTDLDRFCNIGFDSILKPETKCVLPTCLDFDFSQDFMMSSPENPIYKHTYNLLMHRRREGHTRTYFLGPQTYMHGVTDTLFGEMINTDPGLEKFTAMRKKIDTIPFIQTYREHPPYDTVMYKHDAETFKLGTGTTADWVQMKKDFYAENKLKHWSGDW